jgi:hypothetical protein
MAHALKHASEHEVVHRDVKPSNILLTKKQGQMLAKLSDFGLAQITTDRETRLTRDGYTVGTVDYMAPEQAKDSASADVRSDMYALGCTIYHALTGAPAFEGSLAERIYKRFDGPPLDVRRRNPAVPADLADLLTHLLQPAPEERFQTPDELLAALTAEPRPPAKEVAGAENVRQPPASAQQKVAAGRYAYAMQLLAAGEVAEAARTLHECCKFDPYNIDYRRRLRRVQEARPRGWRERCFAWFRVLRLQRQLQTARKSGENLKVLELGEQILADRPEDVAAPVAMAQAAEALGQIDLAVWLLKHARRKDVPNLAVKRALAQLHENQGNLPAAIAAWEAVRRADAFNTEAENHIRDLSARETIVRGGYRDIDDDDQE